MEIDERVHPVDTPPAGRAWDPTVGLHDLDLEEWEKAGKFQQLLLATFPILS
jgi:hypothetical protein